VIGKQSWFWLKGQLRSGLFLLPGTPDECLVVFIGGFIDEGRIFEERI